MLYIILFFTVLAFLAASEANETAAQNRTIEENDEPDDFMGLL